MLNKQTDRQIDRGDRLPTADPHPHPPIPPSASPNGLKKRMRVFNLYLL